MIWLNSLRNYQGQIWTTALYLFIVSPCNLEGQSQNGLRYEDLEFDPLTFDQPSSTVHRILGEVDVLFLEDNSLPLVSLFARFRGGTSYFAREERGAVTAVPMLLRSGGTVELTPDSIDSLLEHYAINLSFGRDGRTSFSSLNTLTDYLEESLQLWEDLLTRPRFSSEMVQVWRNQELDYLRRSENDPNTIAVRTFNRLMYGEHPTGWSLLPEDLEIEDLELEKLRRIHKKIFCRENLTLGVTGNIKWSFIFPQIRKLVESVPSCEDDFENVSRAPVSADPGIYIVPNDLPQATIIIGKHSEIRLDNTPEYFASQIGNLILGGSGLNSRLSKRIRTEQGLSYSTSSIWTTPTKPPGVLAVITQTKAENTATVINMISDVLQEMSDQQPNSKEVQNAIDEISNGFVFNFQNPEQIVSRQMFYLAQNLPLNWLSTYLEGIQQVSAENIRTTLNKTVDQEGFEGMVTVIVGDSTKFKSELEHLGITSTIQPR